MDPAFRTENRRCMMNKEQDYYYYILGLKPGASLDEIESAFRRLVKLYCADRDQSLDAEMKYREIQVADNVLYGVYWHDT